MDKILKKIISLRSNTLVRGSAILFSATMIVNFGNYMFQLIMGNLLGTAEYGNFVALTSLTYLVTLPAGALQVFTAKNTSEFMSKNEKDRIKYFVTRLSTIVLILSAIIGIMILFFIPTLGKFLKIDSYSSFIVLLVYFIFITTNSIILGVLLGQEKFKNLAISYILDVTFKLSVGILLVTQGFKAPGALIGLVTGSLMSLSFGLFSIRDVIKQKLQKIKIQIGKKEFLTILFVSSSINIFLISDLLLAKHYLTDQEAGIYSSISVLGRVLFFLSVSIGSAIIPATVKAKNTGGNYKRNFLFTLLATVSASALVLLIYTLFPELIVKLLYGNSFKEAASFIGKFGLAMLMLSLINIFHNYLIAINKRMHVFIAVLAIFVQIFLMTQYHSSINDFVNIQLTVLSITAGLFFVYWILISKGQDKIQN